MTTGCTSESVLKVRGDVLHRNTETSTPERKYLQGVASLPTKDW